MAINTGVSLFEENGLKINNSQNNEEDEYLEDQIRHKAELKNLLTTELNDFNYEDSTINSSTNNSILNQHDGPIYQNAVNPDDQLKILYESRCDEVQNLKTQLEILEQEKEKEIQDLKRKLLLNEADIRKLQISFKNSESLLIEKSETIKFLQDQLSEKDKYIGRQNDTIEKLETDICIYKSENNELRIKLNENNEFKKQYQVEEIQKVANDHILKLENLLNEQNKRFEYLEKENLNLRNEIAKLVDLNNQSELENKHTVNTLLNSFDSAQQQCKELIQVVETLTTENEYLKGRLENDFITDIPERNGSLEEVQCEKLKQMLSDKSVEIKTLKKKLTNYEENLKELLEFRQIKTDIYKEDFQECDNILHVKNLLVMQHELKSLQNIITDRDKQVSNLSSINRELQEKIEEMLQQTRNDIQNLSHKYNLPQLEKMSEELRLAHEQIVALKEELERKNKNSDDSILKQQLEITQQQILQIQKFSENEKKNFEELIKILQKNLQLAEEEGVKYKKYYKELKRKLTHAEIKNEISNHEVNNCLETTNQKLINKYETQYAIIVEHSKLLNSILVEMQSMTSMLKEDIVEKIMFNEKIQDWYDKLSESYINVCDNFLNEKIKIEQIEDDTNISLKEISNQTNNIQNTVSQEKKSNLQDMLSKENIKKMEQDKVKELEQELQDCKIQIANLKEELFRLQSNLQESELKIIEKNNCLEVINKEKITLLNSLDQTRNELDNTKREVLKLQKELVCSDNNNIKKCIETQLKMAENNLSQSECGNNEFLNNANFNKYLQTETLKIEIKLRDEINAEFSQKMCDLENSCKKLLLQNTEFYRKELNNLKQYEKVHRLQMGQLLSQCSAKILELENEKAVLMKKLNEVNFQHQEFEKYRTEEQKKYNKIFQQIDLETEKNVKVCKSLIKDIFAKTLNIESTNRKFMETIFKNLNNSDKKVTEIERQFMVKVKKYVKEETKKLKDNGNR